MFEKLAVSVGWIKKHLSHGVHQRIGQQAGLSTTQGLISDAVRKYTMKNIKGAKKDVGVLDSMTKKAFWQGFTKRATGGALQDYFADVGADARDKKESSGNFYDENRNWRDAIQYAPSHDQINESKGPR